MYFVIFHVIVDLWASSANFALMILNLHGRGLFRNVLK